MLPWLAPTSSFEALAELVVEEDVLSDESVDGVGDESLSSRSWSRYAPRRGRAGWLRVSWLELLESNASNVRSWKA